MAAFCLLPWKCHPQICVGLMCCFLLRNQIPFTVQPHIVSLLNIADCWQCCCVAIILKSLCSIIDNADQLAREAAHCRLPLSLSFLSSYTPRSRLDHTTPGLISTDGCILQVHHIMLVCASLQFRSRFDCVTTPCSILISSRRGCVLQVYYTTPINKTEVKGFWCHACYQDNRGERIELDGTNVSILAIGPSMHHMS